MASCFNRSLGISSASKRTSAGSQASRNTVFGSRRLRLSGTVGTRTDGQYPVAMARERGGGQVSGRADVVVDRPESDQHLLRDQKIRQLRVGRPEKETAGAAADSLPRGRPAAPETLGTPRRAPVPMRVVRPSRPSILVLAIAFLFRETRRMPTLSAADGFKEAAAWSSRTFASDEAAEGTATCRREASTRRPVPRGCVFCSRAL